MVKAIKTFTPTNTLLTDQQKKDYVPIFLPSGATGRRLITDAEITQAVAQLPSGTALRASKHFLYERHKNRATPHCGTHTLQTSMRTRPLGTKRGACRTNLQTQTRDLQNKVVSSSRLIHHKGHARNLTRLMCLDPTHLTDLVG